MVSIRRVLSKFNLNRGGYLNVKAVFLFTLLFLSLTFVQKVFGEDQHPEDIQYVQGRVIEVIEERQIEINESKQLYQKLKITITRGDIKDREIIVENGLIPSAQVIKYNVGEELMISVQKDSEGQDMYYIIDYVRTKALTLLFLLFVGVAVLIGSKKGLYSLVAMVLSFFIIVTFVLPQIQQGRNPILIAILASALMVPLTFYLSHGLNKKTTISVIATFITLIITGIFATIFVNRTYLTGATSEEALFLQTPTTHYNLKGLLLAGIIIGTLGIMDDITVSQTTVVFQLNDLRKDLSISELFKRSLQIGRDHISSMINTLILVYVGASLPLLLLFMNNPRPFGEIINLEIIAVEIVQTLVGSIGLILAVPITTYLACLSSTNK